MNLLITSVGRRSYIVEYFKAAMVDAGVYGEVHVMNSSPISPAFRLADKAVVSPIAYSDEYIPFLLDYCRMNRISALISLFDIDLLILARNRKKFNRIGVKLLVSETSVVDICNDKWKTYRFLNENDINTPATWLSINDALQAFSKKGMSWPLIVKPRWGMGSIGIQEAWDEEELEVLYRIVKRKIKNSYLKYESMASEQCVLIQEYVYGEEYGLDAINDLQGNYCTTIVKQKYGMRSGETDCAKTIKEERISNLGKILAEKLRHYGNVDVDVLKRGTELYVIDMNARVGGGYPFSHIAGANLPYAIIKWLVGQDVSDDILETKSGVMAQKDITIMRY